MISSRLLDSLTEKNINDNNDINVNKLKQLGKDETTKGQIKKNW